MTRLDLTGYSVLQVYPNILVGNKAAAENPRLLTQLGISHLLNCAGGVRRGNLLTGSGKVRPQLGGRDIEYKELALRVDIKTKQFLPNLLYYRTRRGRTSWTSWRTRLTGWREFWRPRGRSWSTVSLAPVGQPLSPWHF